MVKEEKPPFSASLVRVSMRCVFFNDRIKTKSLEDLEERLLDAIDIFLGEGRDTKMLTQIIVAELAHLRIRSKKEQGR